MTVTPLGRDQDCSLKIREPDVPASWFLDPGGWSKTAAVSLYFIFSGICTLSLFPDCLNFSGRTIQEGRLQQPGDLKRLQHGLVHWDCLSFLGCITYSESKLCEREEQCAKTEIIVQRSSTEGWLYFHTQANPINAEMLESDNVITFSGLANSSSYHTFLLDEERSRLYVGAKDHIFSFNLVNIKDYQKIVWPVSYTRRDECKWAGKDILKECANFIKVLKAYNHTHLYACGTGAFHPICTYIEVGHHPE
ncbi:hypothetical protein STEG23_014630, partial [Scotinomys teguina]